VGEYYYIAVVGGDEMWVMVSSGLPVLGHHPDCITTQWRRLPRFWDLELTTFKKLSNLFSKSCQICSQKVVKSVLKKLSNRFWDL